MCHPWCCASCAISRIGSYSGGRHEARRVACSHAILWVIPTIMFAWVFFAYSAMVFFVLSLAPDLDGAPAGLDHPGRFCSTSWCVVVGIAVVVVSFAVMLVSIGGCSCRARKRGGGDERLLWVALAGAVARVAVPRPVAAPQTADILFPLPYILKRNNPASHRIGWSRRPRAADTPRREKGIMKRLGKHCEFTLVALMLTVRSASAGGLGFP